MLPGTSQDNWMSLFDGQRFERFNLNQELWGNNWFALVFLPTNEQILHLLLMVLLDSSFLLLCKQRNWNTSKEFHVRDFVSTINRPSYAITLDAAMCTSLISELRSFGAAEGKFLSLQCSMDSGDAGNLFQG